MSRGISNQAIYNYNMVTYEDDNKSVCLNLDPDLTKMSDFILTSSLSEKVQKRVDYIEWDEYFMAMTFLELQRNSHKHKNDAAIILNKRKIIISMATSNILEETNMKTETTPGFTVTLVYYLLLLVKF
jgi:deoxycytidylate deaminase